MPTRTSSKKRTATIATKDEDDSKKRKIKEETSARKQPKRKVLKPNYKEWDQIDDKKGVKVKTESRETHSDEWTPKKTKQKLKPKDKLETEELSSYEQDRLANIAKNSQFLASLGISPIKPNLPPKSKKRQKGNTRPPVDPTRYALRSKGALPALEPATSASEEEEEVISDEEPVFKESNIFVYSCKEEIFKKGKEEISENILPRKYVTGDEFEDSELSKIYCMDFYENLLAVGGHGGRLSIFGNSSEPILSWKGHNGWISDVLFVNKLLLTSSNDKKVSLWNLNLQKEKQPKSVFSLKNASGVFSMHSKEGYVVTGHKDGSIVYSQLNNTELSIVKTFDVHKGVVKCVNMWDSNVFVLAGNERVVRVVDVRTGDVSIEIEDAHDCCINSATWHPLNKNLIMTASFDTNIHLWDVRKTSKPLFTYNGHISEKLSKTKNIYHPVFCCEGKIIASVGEKSKKLSLYSVESGKVLSRGLLDFEGSSLAVDSRNSRKLAVSCNKKITMLNPVYEQ